jgi:AraC-like DNA-binding protein
MEFAENAGWNSRNLARNCKVSLRTLERFFLKEFNLTPKAWMIEQRQLLAAKRLREGAWQKEVAADAGYKHPTQFSREFKAYWQCSPTKYLQKFAQKK